VQRWEHLAIHVEAVSPDSADLRVVVENGQKLSGKGPSGRQKLDTRPSYWDYIQQKGDEGWEIVGVTPLESWRLHVVFKRPKP